MAFVSWTSGYRSIVFQRSLFVLRHRSAFSQPIWLTLFTWFVGSAKNLFGLLYRGTSNISKCSSVMQMSQWVKLLVNSYCVHLIAFWSLSEEFFFDCWHITGNLSNYFSFAFLLHFGWLNSSKELFIDRKWSITIFNSDLNLFPIGTTNQQQIRRN